MPKKPELLAVVVQSLEDVKGQNIETMDVSDMTAITDHMVVVSGTSQRHLQSMAQKLMATIKQHGFDINGAEGLNQSDWVLVDCFGVMVHLMMPAERAKVDLESLWQRGAKAELGNADDSRSMAMV